jgi:hypothetical protein
MVKFTFLLSFDDLDHFWYEFESRFFNLVDLEANVKKTAMHFLLCVTYSNEQILTAELILQYPM